MQNMGVSTTELIQSELGKNFVEAKQRAERKNMSYRENEIGESVVVAYNPYTLKNQRNKFGELKFPYAEVISKAFDNMLKEIIPQEAIISSSFQSWINREKNELMLDSRINNDAYLKEQINFETGEVNTNYGNALILAKMELLNKLLVQKLKAFRTHMSKNPDKAFADEEALQKYSEYYKNQANKVSKMLESGDFSYYDKKDKEGNVVQKGTQEDALKHQNNLQSNLEKIDKAQTEQSLRVNQSQESQRDEIDYVGNALDNTQTNKNRYRMQ